MLQTNAERGIAGDAIDNALLAACTVRSGAGADAMRAGAIGNAVLGVGAMPKLNCGVWRRSLNISTNVK